MVSSLCQRLLQLPAELGWPGAALYVAQRLLQGLLPQSRLVCYRLLAQPVLPAARLPASRGQHYAFRLLTRAEPVLLQLGRPEAVIAQRFAQGAQCLLATRGQALAGCIWFVRAQYCDDEVRVDYVLPPGSVWDFDVFVAQSERLGFLFARQWDVLDALLRQTQVQRSFSRINALNRISLASHRRLGASDVGWALFVCLGRRQLMLSSLAPFVALGGRPRLRLPGARA